MLASLHQAKTRFGVPAGYLSQALKYDPALVQVSFDFQALHGRQQGQPLDEALDRIEESILRQGNEPESLFMRAYFRFRKGQTDQARQDLLEAQRLQESLLDEAQKDSDQLLEAIQTFLNQFPEAE
jgi:tetratricopeptide (TPR) repeat protein